MFLNCCQKTETIDSTDACGVVSLVILGSETLLLKPGDYRMVLIFAESKKNEVHCYPVKLWRGDISPSENDVPFETNSTAARTSLKYIVLIAFNEPFCDSCCFWMVESCLVYCTALFICMNLEGQHLWAPVKIVYLITQCASTLVTV